MKTALRWLAWSGAALAGFAVAGLLWSAPWLVGVGAASAEDLRSLSGRMSARLPVMIDTETRLDRVEVGAGLEQVLHFRLVNKGAADLDAPAVAARLRARARHGVCSAASISPLVSRGVRVTYVYQDRAGAETIRFSVDPLECLWVRLRNRMASA